MHFEIQSTDDIGREDELGCTIVLRKSRRLYPTVLKDLDFVMI